MVVSRYAKVLQDFPKKSRFVLYSFLYDSLAIVNSRIYAKLEWANTLSMLRNALSENEYHTLDRLRILRQPNEKQACAALLKEMTNTTKTLNLIVYVTNECNLNCFYCFQPTAARHGSLAMTKETARSLMRWIVSFCREKEVKNLSVLFYGGEPLLNKSILKYLANHVYNSSRRLGIKHDLLITTNGTLLDRDLVKELRFLGLSDIQVTLDGLKQKHDVRRPFKGCKESSYDPIMDNLTWVTKLTSKVILRINVDKDNAEEIPDFLTLLKSNKLAGKVKVHLMPVYKPVRDWAQHSSRLIPSTKLADYLLGFYAVAEKLGLDVVPYYSAGICQFHGRFSFSITPDGRMYKCPNLLQTACRVGDIHQGLWEELNDKVRTVPMQECLACKFVPICARGCRHQAFVRRHDVRGKFCQRALLERLTDFYIKHEVKERLNSNGRNDSTG